MTPYVVTFDGSVYVLRRGSPAGDFVHVVPMWSPSDSAAERYAAIVADAASRSRGYAVSWRRA
jgi:hypothetical protein